MEPQKKPRLDLKSHARRDEDAHSSLSRHRDAYVPLPNLQSQPPRKPNKTLRGFVIAVALALVLGAGSLYYHYEPPIFTNHVQQANGLHLTLSAADLDKNTTMQAIGALKNGTNIPLISTLSDLAKTELLNGKRQFYQIPVLAKQKDELRQGDRIRVAFNGILYGEYDLGQVPATLTLPLKLGDTVTITCLSVSEGKQSLSFEMNTQLNPVETDPLKPGEQEVWSVVRVYP
jgi:hypothetical protein